MINEAQDTMNMNGEGNKVFPESTEDIPDEPDDFRFVCRICAVKTRSIIPLFEKEGTDLKLVDKINKYLPIKLTQLDLLPIVVCEQCSSAVLAWHELVVCCVQADGSLRKRLALALSRAVVMNKAGTVNIDEQKLEAEANKYKKFAEYVVQALDTPPYMDTAISPARALTKWCNYCNKDYEEDTFRDHQMKVHSDSLCLTCGLTFIPSDYFEHIATHATESNENIPIIIVKSDDEEHEPETSKQRTQSELSTGLLNLSVVTYAATPSSTKVFKETENEFSDPSDVEPFAHLPESVFEAIEDSQDAQTQIAEPCAEKTVKAESQPVITDPVKKSKKHKKTRTCPVCNKVYTASSSYFYHMKHFHQRVKNHKCDVCNQGFGTRSDLRQHSTVHTGQFPYECRQCGKKFRSKACHYIHEETHKDVKRYTCGVCGTGFRWRTHLSRHEQRHAAEKRHVCNSCGRAFKVRCDLLRHAQTHESVTYACDTCDLKFAQLRYLRTHMTKKHNTSVPKDVRILRKKI